VAHRVVGDGQERERDQRLVASEGRPGEACVEPEAGETGEQGHEAKRPLGEAEDPRDDPGREQVRVGRDHAVLEGLRQLGGAAVEEARREEGLVAPERKAEGEPDDPPGRSEGQREEQAEKQAPPAARSPLAHPA
jgi:hypothetical protein